MGATLPRRLQRRRLGYFALSAVLVVGLFGVGGAYFRPLSLRTVTVPDVVGLTMDQAKAALAHVGLQPQFQLRESRAPPIGTASPTKPRPPGWRLPAASACVCSPIFSRGPFRPSYRDPPGTSDALLAQAAFFPDLEAAGAASEQKNSGAHPYLFSGLPSVVGKSVAEATQQLRPVGLMLRVQGWTLSASVPAGGVLRQEPAAGAGAPNDDTVRVVVSAGPGVPMPAVVGKQERSPGGGCERPVSTYTSLGSGPRRTADG